MGIFDFSFGYYSEIGIPLQMFAILCFIIEIVGFWRVFEKAGQKGWKSIIPIYNLYILFKITNGEGIYFLLLLIPIADIVIWIIMEIRLAKAFWTWYRFYAGSDFLRTDFSSCSCIQRR